MQVSYVLVSVTDLDRSIAFFRDLIGLKLMFANPAFGFAQFDGGGVQVRLVAGGEGHQLLPYPVVGFSVDDLEATYAELSAKGVAFPMTPTRQDWGGVLARFADPDGNLFYIDQRG